MEVESESSEEIYYFKGKQHVAVPRSSEPAMQQEVPVLRSPAVKPEPASQFSPGRELARSRSVSRMSALREKLEQQGQSFVEVHLEPLSRERQYYERQDRLLELQLKWGKLVRDGSVAPADALAQYAAELDELAENFVLAYGDYVAQRLNAPEAERLARVKGFRASVQVERDHWRAFPKGLCRELAEGFVRETESLLDECMEKLLRVEAVQMEAIGQFEEVQIFGQKKLRDATMENSSEDKDKVERFCRVCESGELAAVQAMLKTIRGKKQKLAFAMEADASGAAGVHFSCRNGHAAVVAELLRVGVPVNSADAWHSVPPVFWAVSNPAVSCEAVLAELFGHADICVTAKGRSVLHFAARFGNFTAVQALVEKFGVSVKDTELSTGRTALHISCSRGYMGITSYLLSRGADPLAQNIIGESPLYEAYLCKNAPVVMLLARKGVFLTALEQDKLQNLFHADSEGKKLLALPHEDALRRLTSLNNRF